MNVALRQTMAREQFLDWEARQPVKYEFDGLRPVAMTGGTEAHATTQVNLLAALPARLRNTRCRALGSELKIAAGAAFRYPDAFIVCTPVVPGRTVALHPVVVFEILSASSETTCLIRKNGRVTKNLEYRATPSIQRTVILEQSEIGAHVFARAGDLWISTVHGPRSRLLVPEAGIEIPLDDLYDGLTFGEPPGGA